MCLLPTASSTATFHIVIFCSESLFHTFGLSYTLKMEVENFYETSVPNYQTKLHRIQEDSEPNLHTHRRECLKPHILAVLLCIKKHHKFLLSIFPADIFLQINDKHVRPCCWFYHRPGLTSPFSPFQTHFFPLLPFY
jgi:hypothetical protein